MKELSLNILDIVQNSISAEASLIEILLTETDETLRITIKDDGRGMSQEFLATVMDPFSTTRKTRKVGMGIPLFKLAAEQTGGDLVIESSVVPPTGTTLSARFRMDHLDCVPVGDYASSIVTLIQGSPDIDFLFEYRREDGQEVVLDTAQIREILGPEVPLDTPDVLVWMEGSLQFEQDET